MIASVDPQHTVISFSGSTVIPCHTPICRAIAFRRFFAPQVIAYWFTSAATACCAACLISGGAEKSGNPCARFTAPCSIACRVISRITDSVKCPTLSLRKCLPAPCEESACAPFLAFLARSDFVSRAPAEDFVEDRAAVFLALLKVRCAISRRLAQQMQGPAVLSPLQKRISKSTHLWIIFHLHFISVSPSRNRHPSTFFTAGQ